MKEQEKKKTCVPMATKPTPVKCVKKQNCSLTSTKACNPSTATKSKSDWKKNITNLYGADKKLAPSTYSKKVVIVEQFTGSQKPKSKFGGIWQRMKSKLSCWSGPTC